MAIAKNIFFHIPLFVDLSKTWARVSAIPMPQNSITGNKYLMSMLVNR